MYIKKGMVLAKEKMKIKLKLLFFLFDWSKREQFVQSNNTNSHSDYNGDYSLWINAKNDDVISGRREEVGTLCYKVPAG